MITPQDLADRVIRARRESVCPICRQLITIGQQIGRLGAWQHIEHIIERQRQHAALAAAAEALGKITEQEGITP